MRSDYKSMGELKKKSLKKVLSFLFKIVCTDDNVNLFEKLYHYNARYRVEAIKYLVKNFDQMSFSDDSKGLLKDSIAERVNDESPLVVYEALQFEPPQLMKIIGKNELKKKLITILEKTLEKPSIWEKSGLAALKHLIKLETKQDNIDILVAVLPFILQQSSLNIEFARTILNSQLAKWPFIKTCKEAIGSGANKDELFDKFSATFATKKGLPPTALVLRHIDSIEENDLTLANAFYSMLLLAHSINTKLPADIGLKLLNVVARYEAKFKTVYVEDQSKWFMQVAMGVYPLNLNVVCIQNIIDSIAFDIVTEKPNFDKPSNHLKLLHAIVERFATGMSRYPKEPINKLYKSGMQYLFEKAFRSYAKRIAFVSNYFTIDSFALDNSIRMDDKLQVFFINYFNSILENDKCFENIEIDLASLIRILSGLRSTNAAVREASYETFEALSKSK